MQVRVEATGLIDVCIQVFPDAGGFVNERVISDLWWQVNGVNNFMSIKL